MKGKIPEYDKNHKFSFHSQILATPQLPSPYFKFNAKIPPGACPKSFGFNAARLAGIPEKVISEAHRISSQFEKLSDRFHIVGKLVNGKSDIDAVCAKLVTLLS